MVHGNTEMKAALDEDGVAPDGASGNSDEDALAPDAASSTSTPASPSASPSPGDAGSGAAAPPPPRATPAPAPAPAPPPAAPTDPTAGASPYASAHHAPTREARGDAGRDSSPNRPAPQSLAVVAIALAIVALAVVVSFWREQSQLLQDLGSAREAAGAARADVASATSELERRLEGRLATQESRMRELEPTVATLAQGLAAVSREVDAQGARLTESEQAVARTEQSLADAGGALRDARDRWVMAEVEYLLQTANTALQLARDPRAAIAALEAADDHLKALANPRLTRTREALAEDLTALRAMPAPDVAGVAVTLASLASSADTLPLTEDRRVNYPVAGGDPDEAPGWGRAWSALKGALSSLVSFQRDDGDVIPLLQPDERFFLRRNLELQITSARLAALNGDQVNYRLSLEAAQRTLDAGFDGRANAVAAARSQLEELAAIDIAPPRPDISGSLLALREAAERIR